MTKYDDAVYDYLAARVDSDGLCSVPLALIATGLGISLNTVRRAIYSLRDDGRLEIVHSEHGGPNYYAIISPPSTVENPPGTGLHLVHPLPDPLPEMGGGPPKPQVNPYPRENLTPSVDSKPPRGFESTEGQVSISLGQTTEPPAKANRPYGDDIAGDYLKCECGRPKIADEAVCLYCGRTYSHVTPADHPRRPNRTPTHDPNAPATTPDQYDPTYDPTPVIEGMREVLRRASLANRYQRWNRRTNPADPHPTTTTTQPPPTHPPR